MIWLNKNMTLYQVHFEVFRFLRHSLSAIYTSSTMKAPFRKQTIDENDAGTPLSKEEYEALSLEDAFQATFLL